MSLARERGGGTYIRVEKRVTNLGGGRLIFGGAYTRGGGAYLRNFTVFNNVNFRNG